MAAGLGVVLPQAPHQPPVYRLPSGLGHRPRPAHRPALSLEPRPWSSGAGSGGVRFPWKTAAGAGLCLGAGLELRGLFLRTREDGEGGWEHRGETGELRGSSPRFQQCCGGRKGGKSEGG